uniref:Uncharacterized protein n=1 Tax=Arundo donax TaxID=35708 RepID=A0A0A9C2U9_ARUDO
MLKYPLQTRGNKKSHSTKINIVVILCCEIIYLGYHHDSAITMSQAHLVAYTTKMIPMLTLAHTEECKQTVMAYSDDVLI